MRDFALVSKPFLLPCKMFCMQGSHELATMRAFMDANYCSHICFVNNYYCRLRKDKEMVVEKGNIRVCMCILTRKTSHDKDLHYVHEKGYIITLTTTCLCLHTDRRMHREG